MDEVPTKQCTKCKVIKPISDFNKKKSSKDGLYSSCRQCQSDYNKEYYRSGRATIKAKEWSLAHPGRLNEVAREWRKANPERHKANRKRCYLKNKDKILATNREYFKLHAKEIKEKQTQYRHSRIEKERENRRNWAKNNPEKVKESSRKKNQKILATPQGKLNCNMSRAVRTALSNIGKVKNGARWEHLLGYNRDDLKLHLESLFTDGMSWENYGKNGWEIDHKIPQVAFKYESVDDPEFKKCWALENLQPLWGFDNRSKGDKLIYQNIDTSKDVLLEAVNG